ncbi:hypothetical protein HQ38_04395 [Porphyromonas crevioricanis]|uniref:Uncharacterized protein n=1 Tax=Porphyromonas crevioricanis TaxID=393921 RepID=A0AB34PGT3_9PORP|nr:hypothetical protein HQ38_04395 [Porphyromonas crevioricanis]
MGESTQTVWCGQKLWSTAPSEVNMTSSNSYRKPLYFSFSKESKAILKGKKSCQIKKGECKS